jgi:hypothetical protein
MRFLGQRSHSLQSVEKSLGHEDGVDVFGPELAGKIIQVRHVQLGSHQGDQRVNGAHNRFGQHVKTFRSHGGEVHVLPGCGLDLDHLDQQSFAQSILVVIDVLDFVPGILNLDSELVAKDSRVRRGRRSVCRDAVGGRTARGSADRAALGGGSAAAGLGASATGHGSTALLWLEDTFDKVHALRVVDLHVCLLLLWQRSDYVFE